MTDINPGDWAERDDSRPSEALARATDPSVRKNWSKVIASLHEEAKSADPFLFSHELLEHMCRFEAAMFPSYREILGTTLLWDDNERAFAQWVKACFHTLARTAADALHRAAAHDTLLSGSGGELAALALTGYGNAIKWAEISSAGYDPVSVVEIRRVQDSVERAAIGADRFPVPRDNFAASPTLDALFIRALLLEAICRGNLEPRQVEIVDGWLWEWSSDYAFTDSDAGAVLVLESGRQRGLRPRNGEARGRRYLSLEKLEDHIRMVVDAFRRGEIYPGYGLAVDFRVEEHTAVLDFLRRFLDSARYRRARESHEGRDEKLEALVGLHEVMAKAFSPRTSPLAPRKSAKAAPAPSGQQLPGIDTMYDIPRRYMRLLDESADGLGVEYDDDPARPVVVGMVITLHHDETSPPVLCEVMRRSLVQGRTVRLGLRILSHAPKKLAFTRIDGAGTIEAIYVPSEDASGQVDSLLVAEGDFNPRVSFEARFDDRAFVIRLNHVRYHGRGWHLAGFEVSEERAPGTAPAAEGMSVAD